MFGWERIVVEQPSGVFPAVLGVEDTGRTSPRSGREVQAGQFLLLGPSDKGPRPAAPGGGGGGHPLVEVGWVQVAEREMRCGSASPKTPLRLAMFSRAAVAWLAVMWVARVRWRSRRSTCQTA